MVPTNKIKNAILSGVTSNAFSRRACWETGVMSPYPVVVTVTVA